MDGKILCISNLSVNKKCIWRYIYRDISKKSIMGFPEHSEDAKKKMVYWFS